MRHLVKPRIQVRFVSSVFEGLPNYLTRARYIEKTSHKASDENSFTAQSSVKCPVI